MDECEECMNMCMGVDVGVSSKFQLSVLWVANRYVIQLTDCEECLILVLPRFVAFYIRRGGLRFLNECWMNECNKIKWVFNVCNIVILSYISCECVCGGKCVKVNCLLLLARLVCFLLTSDCYLFLPWFFPNYITFYCAMSFHEYLLMW